MRSVDAVIVADRTPSSISAISPKWSPGPRLARSLPATETAASPDSIRKNAAPSAPSLTTVSPATKCRSLNRSAICSTSSALRSVKRGTRCSAATGAPAISCSPCPRHGPALEQVELAPCDRPLDVAARPVDLLAAQRERVELREVRVVEAELLRQLGRNLLLDGAAACHAADCDALQARPPLEHRAVAVDPEAVRD